MASKEIIKKELEGSFRSSREMTEKKFLKAIDNSKKYGGNHIGQMMKYIKKYDCILELGAGTGWASSILYVSGYKNLIITDINPFDFNGLGAVKRLIKENVAVELMDFENISHSDSSLDVVFMVSALHHSSNVEKVSEEVFRVLRPGGKWFILGEPVKGWLDRENMSIKDSRKDGFNDNYYRWTYYRKAMKGAGFDIKVLFPEELHLFLSGKLEDNCKSREKKAILRLSKRIYKTGGGKKVIRGLYPASLYFLGSHAVIMAEKKM